MKTYVATESFMSDHPLNSLDITPCDSFLFPKVKSAVEVVGVKQT